MRGHGLSSGVPQAQCSHNIVSTDQTQQADQFTVINKMGSEGDNQSD